MNILFAKEAFALPVTLPLFCFKPVYPTPVARAHTHTHTHTPGSIISSPEHSINSG